ncbi:tRNA (adenosine(37)-N6)-threonylcarbamoyltransferase complex ATPase subunit type 1 TsaE [Candidatus Saccharibacteria bacterium]|nr:tRNA (adenosine(37)-N6)-threonylcarbamoyltransferase complex ATPase subunit type 1 TsaE [Candidatus Saccharibacteria bacterium]
MEYIVNSADEMVLFGIKLGFLLHGGETIELIGDVGAGKTTFTKGIAKGLAVDEDVQSPTFTISRVYNARDNLRLVHYDFYRLTDAGILNDELHESIADPFVITVLEWASIVSGALQADILSIKIVSPDETTRRITIEAKGSIAQSLMEKLQ